MPPHSSQMDPFGQPRVPGKQSLRPKGALCWRLEVREQEGQAGGEPFKDASPSGQSFQLWVAWSHRPSRGVVLLGEGRESISNAFPPFPECSISGPVVCHPILWLGESYLSISSPLKHDLLRAASRQLVPSYTSHRCGHKFTCSHGHNHMNSADRRFSSNSGSATHQLWDLEQVTESLCTSISLSAKWEQK